MGVDRALAAVELKEPGPTPDMRSVASFVFLLKQDGRLPASGAVGVSVVVSPF